MTYITKILKIFRKVSKPLHYISSALFNSFVNTTGLSYILRVSNDFTDTINQTVVMIT